MVLPDRVPPDGFGPVEANNNAYWDEINEMGKRGELPERIWPRRDEEEVRSK